MAQRLYFLIVCGLAIGVPAPPAESAEHKPNILVILCDDVVLQR
jgi:hypothetical protein